MSQLCTHSPSSQFTKNGSWKGVQRYQCKSCQRYFSDKPRKFSDQQKAKAIEMYLNNVGIRKIAQFIGCSPPSVLYWIKKEGKKIEGELKNKDANDPPPTSVTIEMDQIYTFVKKNSKGQLYGLAIVGK